MNLENRIRIPWINCTSTCELKRKGDRKLLRSAAILIFSLLQTGTASFTAESVLIIMFPLENRTGMESLDWLGEGIATSVSRQLQTATVDAVERNQRLDLIRKSSLPTNAPISRGSMIGLAQKTSADWIVMGTISGTDRDLKITIKSLDVRALKLSGEIVANGRLDALQQMENDLAWLILTNTGLEMGASREKFAERKRKIPNTAYSYFVQSLSAPKANTRLQLLHKAVESYNDFPAAHFELGRLHFELEDCASAMPHLLVVPGMDEAYLEGEFIRGICSLRENLPDMAIGAFSNLLAHVDSFEILNNLGVAYMYKGDLKLASEKFAESKTLAPANTALSLNTALVQYMRGDFSAALDILNASIKADPSDGKVQFLKSFLLQEQGIDEGAAEALDKARELGIQVEELQEQEPKEWLRVFSSWNYVWVN